MPYFSPGKKPPRESFPLTSHRLGKKREFEMSWAPGVAPISPPHCHSRLSRGQRRSTTYARHERSKQNSLPRSNLERKQGRRMFCIFEQPLVWARVRVIKATHETEEDGGKFDEEELWAKPNRFTARCSTHLHPMLPRSLPFWKCPSSHIRWWLLRL